MAVTGITSFWSAFVSVLLKCVAALGFATPARTKVQPVAPAPAAAPAVAATPTAPRTGTLLPAPRRERERSLPPTMKQRIRAEAHGASPSARSVLSGDVFTDAIDAYEDRDARERRTGADRAPEPAVC
ncbi:DUF6344 domain-containing protein [Streptomyces sp. CA-111067]|uniref:DUF6344 domain-containing protein n=1 Tax=Streptomyces sp. CA-111067 TaxID=3240046 RepID=UPI003D96B4DB